MASIPRPVCFVLGGCTTEGTSIQPTIILPPTTTLSSITTLHHLSLATSRPHPPSVSLVTPPLPSISKPSLSGPSAPFQTSTTGPSSSAPASSATAPLVYHCHCTSTGTIVGIAVAAASAASMLTMLLLLYILRRNGRPASKNPSRLTDSFPESKNPKPSPSSIRDTVILISPDRATRPVPSAGKMRRSSESEDSQDARHSRGVTFTPDRRRISVPQLPAIALSPPLLVPGPSSPTEPEPKLRLSVMTSTSNLSSLAHAQMRAHAGNGDAGLRGLGSGARSPAGSRIPSVVGGFSGSGRVAGLPRLFEGDGDGDGDAGVRWPGTAAAAPRMVMLSGAPQTLFSPDGRDG